ncbi:MAG: autotransporter assembly complex protein TamA [Steroidobacteraceae bacterium]
MRLCARRGRRVLAVAACLLAARYACAGISVDIEGVSATLRDNVSAYLSLTRYAKRSVDAATMDRLEDRIVRETREALEPFGYYQPTVKYHVTADGNGSWNAAIGIDPGPPVIVKSVEVEISGPGRDDPRFERIAGHPLLEPGDRLLHAAYGQMKTELETTAATYGYFDARMLRNELIVNPRARSARIILEMATGVRYRFGLTTIEQKVIDARLARRYLRYRKGDPYDQSKLLDTQFALDDSDYFSTVAVQPGVPDHVRHIVPVLIRARPNLRDRYSFSGGYGTDTGPRGTLQWDRTRIGTEGDRFGVQLEASKLLQVLQALYTIPAGDPAVDRLALAATADYGIPGNLIDKDFAIGPSLTRVVGRWQYVFAVMPTRSITYDGITTQTQTLLIPSITIGSVPTGYLGQALLQQGLVAQLRGGVSLAGPGGRFLQLHVTGQHTFNLSQRWHLLLRGEAGTSIAPQITDLPGSLRFFAGGEGSVRGFEYDDLSPVQAQLTPSGHTVYLKIGGRDVLTGSAEVVRDVTRHIGIAAFADAGNAFDTFGRSGNSVYPHFIEYSAGLGLLWRLPVLTLGVDVAQPLSRPGAGPRFDIYFGPRL